MKSTVWVLLTLLMATGATAQENGAHPIFAEAPSIDRLENGLTVVTVPWNTPGIVAYYTQVNVGSRDEVEPGRTGFAHFFEHMMFRGTEALPGEAYQRALQAFGADTNAYTTNDYTCYTITAPSSALPRLVEIEADRFQRLSYDEEGFRTEAGAILGEYNTDASDPGLAVSEKIREMAFSAHTYRHTTMGFLRDVCAMPEMLDYSWQFFHRYYTPDNTTIIVVGDVDRDSLLDLVETHYGMWEGQRFDNEVPLEPEPTVGGRAHIAWSGTTAPRMNIGFRVPAFDENITAPDERAQAIRRTAALEVVRGLAFHESAPLYQRLVVQDQVLMRLSSWSNHFGTDPNLLTVSAVLRPIDDFVAPTGFDAVLEAVQAELERIAAGETPPERIAGVQSHIRYAFLSRLETPGRVAGTLASFVSVGGSVDALAEYLDALAAVTPEEVAEAAAAFLVPERRFVVTVAEAAEGEEVSARPTCVDFEDEQNAGGE